MGGRLAAVVVENVDRDGPAGELRIGLGRVREERPALEGDLPPFLVEADNRSMVCVVQGQNATFQRALRTSHLETS